MYIYRAQYTSSSFGLGDRFTNAKPQPAGARSLDDAIRALEGVVAVRPSVGPALELLKKERRGLK